MRTLDDWKATDGREVFRPLAPHELPRDPDRSATGWRFHLLEHGGEEPDTMPQRIEATDAEGRRAIYEALQGHMSPEDRPQDPHDDAAGWTFETHDHDEAGVPHTIIGADAQGRRAAYLPLMHRGKIGRWISSPG